MIALFKLLKGAALIAIAIGALRLLHHDVAEVVEKWIVAIGINTHKDFVQHLLGRLQLVNDHRLKLISAITFGYAALLLTEGVGLFLEKRWAEFLTIIATASLIPLEVYELLHHANWMKVTALVINVVVVIYLIRVVRNKKG